MLKRPDYKGVVACNPGEEKVVGFLIWKRPKKEGEELEEWTPKLPEGTNERFLGMFLSAIEREKGRWSVEELFGKRLPLFRTLFCVVLMRGRA